MTKLLFVMMLTTGLASMSLGFSPKVGEPKNVEDISMRRSLLAGAVSSMANLLVFTGAAQAAETAEVRGTKLTPFNSLAFQYRGTEFAGLQGNAIDEPSISYADFMDKLKSGEIAKVEFAAPDGDVAYAYFTKPDQKPLRVGEGYPIEQHDGYSSPLFAIRAVKNAGVPYKFIVPALSKSL